MFLMPRGASLTMGVLAALVGFQSTDVPADHPHAVVAQSTPATAGTGKRPIGQRIAAANLPLRKLPIPDCGAADTAAACLHENSPGEAAVSDAAPVREAELPASEPVDAVAPEPPETDAEQSDDGAGDAEVALDSPDITAVRHEEETSEEPEPAGVPPLPATTVAPAVAAVQPQRTSAESTPRDTHHETLLGRIKTAFRKRTRGMQPATEPTDAPSKAAAHLPPVTAAEPPPVAVPTAVTPQMPTPESVVPVSEVASTAPSVEAPESGSENVPARLEFDVRESRTLVGEGEQLVMRIAVRNVGGAPAERVSATLFFAEGIEPLQAIGHAAEVYPGEVRFDAVPALPPGSSVDLLVTAVGTRPGSVAYRGELQSLQPVGRAAREGVVTVRPRRAAQP